MRGLGAATPRASGVRKSYHDLGGWLSTLDAFRAEKLDARIEVSSKMVLVSLAANTLRLPTQNLPS